MAHALPATFGDFRVARGLLSEHVMSGVLPIVRARHPAWAAAFLLAAACGGRTTSPGGGASGAAGAAGDGDAGPPGWTDQELGVYEGCTYSDFSMVSGGAGELTLIRTSSGTLQAVYADDAGAAVTFSLTFRPTSGTSATLDPAGQSLPWEGFCWAGSGPPFTEAGLPIDPAPTALTLDVTSGALSYDADTLFLSVVGTPDVDAECEVQPAGSITCARSAQP